jgi:hypothetical protein
MIGTGVLLCVGALACGKTGKDARTFDSSATGSTSAVQAESAVKSYRTGDSDVDDEYGKDDPANNDDYPLTEYGHPASAVERQEIASLLGRYYAAAAAEDGAKACSLLDSHLARDPRLTKTVPEDRFSYPVRVRISPGERCPQVTSTLFKRRHRGLLQKALTLQVTAVRVSGSHGVAVLGFKTAPEHWIPVVREDGVWKTQALLALLLP